MIDLNSYRSQLTQAVSRTQDNLASIRTGRASGSLIENIVVSAYGGQATLKVIELASITNEGPQALLITPFDPSVTQDLEKALRESSLGLSISVSGNQIRAKTPPLTEEQRLKYTKLVSEFAEEGRERIRRERDEIRKTVKAELDKKMITEDDKYRQEAEIDKIAKEFNERIEELKKRKEQEVLTI
jgi:ribosome recycling factor